MDTYNRKPKVAIAKLMNDPMTIFLKQFNELYMVGVYPVYYQLQDALEKNYQLYMKALLEM